MSAQMASMTMIGHTPSSPLYKEVAAEPNANDRTNQRERPSTAYDTIITVTAADPNNVNT